MSDGKKFCFSCQCLRNEATGVWLQRKIRRWVCATCAERKNVSPYARKDTVQKWIEEGRSTR